MAETLTRDEVRQRIEGLRSELVLILMDAIPALKLRDSVWDRIARLEVLSRLDEKAFITNKPVQLWDRDELAAHYAAHPNAHALLAQKSEVTHG